MTRRSLLGVLLGWAGLPSAAKEYTVRKAAGRYWVWYFGSDGRIVITAAQGPRDAADIVYRLLLRDEA